MIRSYLTAIVVALPVMSYGQSYEKNNLPCVVELCIGDGLAELRKIDWDRAKSPFGLRGPEYAGSRPLDRYQLKLVNDAYRGDIASAAPYLSFGAFDRKALPLLAQVTAACTRKELLGTFTTTSGNSTMVKISLVPDRSDVHVQRWTVVLISRDFPKGLSDQQQAHIRSELEQRYGRFSFNRGIQKGIDGVFTTHEDAVRGRYGFSLSLAPDVNDQERYRLHPLCGGAKHIAID